MIEHGPEFIQSLPSESYEDRKRREKQRRQERLERIPWAKIAYGIVMAIFVALFIAILIKGLNSNEETWTCHPVNHTTYQCTK